MSRVACLAVLVVASAASAQGTDVWLFDRTDGLALVARVTDRDGYDNQPAFSADGAALFFVSDRAGATDVFRYRLADGALDNLTRTPDENEYSPTPLGADSLLYVLQEGAPYQHLWRQPLAGGARERALTSFVPVAYYARTEAGTLFWVRYAGTLSFEPAGADVGPGAGESLALTGPAGRSLHAIPGTASFSFLHNPPAGTPEIRRFDPDTRAITPVVPFSGEDYCWAPDGTLLAVDGATVRAVVPGDAAGWRTVGTLRAEGFGRGSRCAVSPDGRVLAVVGTRP